MSKESDPVPGRREGRPAQGPSEQPSAAAVDQGPVLPTRRALRLARLEAERGTSFGDTSSRGAGPAVESSLSVEEAVAAAHALVEDAREQIDNLPAAATADPLAVDPDIMAQQRAMAERAEVLNRHTQAREWPAQDSTQSNPPISDPAAAHNLAMVTPLEFIRVPGIDRPVMRPPTTSHIPVVSRLMPLTRTGPASSPAVPAADVPAQSPTRDQLPAAAFERTERPPLPAGSANGLEPLDAVTAGLGRLQRNRLILWGAILIAAVALITGFILIITGLAR
ncbi:hypothetical protein [Paenarthrobacter sp. PH39-S1]|uniref:hypothetical protein n=1 Tax=Paenarthrobacter sp. PH39-S1 TaxID=3046204 RepID=UPI0024B906D6|nr:hypothetical protein [Paenarthrobacter sp. PH39-S1]MDJ0355406.1 hypothetical protein [Paenarthrobacter sp. PH39-S1]